MKTYIVMYEKETLDQAKTIFESESPAKSDKLYLVGAKETSISLSDAKTLFELPIKPNFVNPAEALLPYTIGYLIGLNHSDNITLIVNRDCSDIQAFVKDAAADVRVIVAKPGKKLKKETVAEPETVKEPVKKPSAKNVAVIPADTPAETKAETKPASAKSSQRKPRTLTADTFEALIKKIERQANIKLKEHAEKIRTVVADASDPDIGLPMLLKLHAIPEELHEIIRNNYSELKRLSH